MTPYELELRDAGDVRVARLRGDLDLTNVPHAEPRLREALRGATVLRLDLEGVGFADSAAVHLLFKLLRAAADGGARLELALDEDAPVARVLRIAGLLDLVAAGPAAEA